MNAKNKESNEDINREMICSFMYEMTAAQLEKLADYAAKLFKDKRYKNKSKNDFRRIN
jgi:hypothetical protein